MEFIRPSGGIASASLDWNIPLEADLNDIYTNLNSLYDDVHTNLNTIWTNDWITYTMLKDTAVIGVIEDVKEEMVLPCIKTIQLEFDHTTVGQQAKPTLVERGVFHGFSLPVYNADNEELFISLILPSDWDGTTNPTIFLGGWLPSANNAKQFELQASVQNCSPATNSAISDTAEDFSEIVTTDDWAANTSYCIAIEIDAVALGLAKGNALGIRIRRINDNITGDEITGEVIVSKGLLRYVSDTIGEELEGGVS